MILLTGSTGLVGSETAKCLMNLGIPFRALVRDVSKATQKGIASAQFVAGDFNDEDSLKRALSGIDRVFLLAPPVENLDLLETKFIEIAKAQGVEHIVNLSAVGAGIDVPHRFGRWHGRTEQVLRESGLKMTILRPNFFMQNLLGMADMVRSGTLYVPAGTGKAPFVDARDIAAVATSCLTEPGHEGKIYEVTGPETVGYTEIAQTLSRVLNSVIEYVDVPAEAATQSMVQAGLPAWLVDALNELNTGLKENRFTQMSDAVLKVGHKPPTTLESFLCEHVNVFG